MAAHHRIYDWEDEDRKPIAALQRFTTLAQAAAAYLTRSTGLGSIPPGVTVGDVLGQDHPLARNQLARWLRSVRGLHADGRLDHARLDVLRQHPVLGMCPKATTPSLSGRISRVFEREGISLRDALLMSAADLFALKGLTWDDVRQLRVAAGHPEFAREDRYTGAEPRNQGPATHRITAR